MQQLWRGVFFSKVYLYLWPLIGKGWAGFCWCLSLGLHLSVFLYKQWHHHYTEHHKSYASTLYWPHCCCLLDNWNCGRNIEVSRIPLFHWNRESEHPYYLLLASLRYTYCKMCWQCQKTNPFFSVSSKT